MRQASRDNESAGVAERLRERREEIEQATMLRIRAVSALPRRGDPEYADGLRRAVAAGLEYGLEGIERGDRDAPPVPDVLLSQARLAARSGISLDTVLRRYLAGHALLDDFLIEEVEHADPHLGRGMLKRLLRSQAAILDRLLCAVSEAYREEAERRPLGAERRRAAQVERLLDGEPIETHALGYDFEGWHVGIAATGPGAGETIATLAGPADARLLTVSHDQGLWAWLGSRHKVDPSDLGARVEGRLRPGLSIALGVPAEGLAGWRLTHRQARAALPLAQHRAGEAVAYADVALLASTMQDDLLATSLRALYLDPLAEERDGGKISRDTLRAYFSSQQHVTSTAAALGVNRNTVANRLRAIEKRIGRPLASCGAELAVALRMEEFRAQGT